MIDALVFSSMTFQTFGLILDLQNFLRINLDNKLGSSTLCCQITLNKASKATE